MSADELESASAGTVLKRAREAMGATQRDIADALHLPIHTIDAIERGDKSRLPAHVFTRGYVRAYAKLLELDPDPLVTTLTFANAESSQTAGEKTRAELPFSKQQLMMGAAALAGVVLLVIILAVTGEDDAPLDEANPAVATRVDDPTLASVAEPSATAAGRDTQAGSIAQAPGNATRAMVEPANTNSATTASSTGASAAAPGTRPVAGNEVPTESPIESDGASRVPTLAAANSDEPRRVRRLNATGDDELVLEFTDDCWVEIKDQAGTTLYANLGAAGRELVFLGEGPFRVLLGYAPGARLIYNAEPVALTPHTRNNVASLVIGQ